MYNFSFTFHLTIYRTQDYKVWLVVVVSPSIHLLPIYKLLYSTSSSQNMEGIFCVSLFAFYDESFVGAKNCIIVLVILMDAAGCANSWQSMANEKN